MSDEVRSEMIKRLNDIKSYLLERNDFYRDSRMRACYVAMLTVEGAVAFDDVIEFSEVCLQFCKHKEDDDRNRN